MLIKQSPITIQQDFFYNHIFILPTHVLPSFEQPLEPTRCIS